MYNIYIHCYMYISIYYTCIHGSLYIYICIIYIYVYLAIYIIHVILYIPMCPYCLTGRRWQPLPLLDARSQRIYETIDKRSKKAQVHFGVKVQGGTSQLRCFFCQLHNGLYGLPNVYIYIVSSQL